MARKKRPVVNLAQPAAPRTGDLDTLFSADNDAEQAAGLQLLAIRIDAIYPDPDQPRQTWPQESLSELSQSIKQDGLIQPIEVTTSGPGRYLIVHGERRWRAAKLAGLETIPAIVRRRAYDEITRYVRQLVENIQREDLNDVDRAAGLLRLRDLMQHELDTNIDTEASGDPWASKISWAKVGGRLGYSRQRIHQLIQLLKLPDVIKEAVINGDLTERDTRIYQGLSEAQQATLHQARMSGEISASEAKQLSQALKKSPDQTIADAIDTVRKPSPPREEQSFNSSFESESPIGKKSANAAGSPPPPDGSESRSASGITRLDWIRGHLARVPRQQITAAERKEMLRLLALIQQDVASLTTSLKESSEG